MVPLKNTLDGIVQNQQQNGMEYHFIFLIAFVCFVFFVEIQGYRYAQYILDFSHNFVSEYAYKRYTSFKKTKKQSYITFE